MKCNTKCLCTDSLHMKCLCMKCLCMKCSCYKMFMYDLFGCQAGLFLRKVRNKKKLKKLKYFQSEKMLF